MADAGARKIGKLLDAKSGPLARNARKMAAGLVARRGDDKIMARPVTFQGIEGVRAYYQDLARQIRAVKTGSSQKAEILDAIKRYDSVLAAFARALKEGSDDAQIAGLKRSARRAKRAASDLGTARGKLT